MENKDETKALAFVPARTIYIPSKLELRESLGESRKEKLPS